MQPTFRFTNNLLPSHHPAAVAILSSEYQAFDRIILGICGGGVSVASTALAMQTRRKLLDLPVGYSISTWLRSLWSDIEKNIQQVILQFVLLPHSQLIYPVLQPADGNTRYQIRSQ